MTSSSDSHRGDFKKSSIFLLLIIIAKFLSSDKIYRYPMWWSFYRTQIIDFLFFYFVVDKTTLY